VTVALGQQLIEIPPTRLWWEAESGYASHGYRGHDSTLVDIRSGLARPLLVLTAPHAVNTVKDGAEKLADRGTGGLAAVLSQSLDCCGVTMRGARNTSWLETLKSAVLCLRPPPRFLLDLHGMKDQRDLDAEIGIGSEPTDSAVDAAATLESLFAEAGLSCAVNEKYCGWQPSSLVKWAQGSGIVALQLELAARARPPVGQKQRAQSVLTVLMCFLEHLYKRFDTPPSAELQVGPR